MRYDLNHPLMRAYREHKVCVVNSFRSEITQKKAFFDLLTDDAVTSSFPTSGKKSNPRIYSLDAGSCGNQHGLSRYLG